MWRDYAWIIFCRLCPFCPVSCIYLVWNIHYTWQVAPKQIKEIITESWAYKIKEGRMTHMRSGEFH